jgi:Uma2 family endonuclease
MTATEYLGWEADQKEKHDFFRGEIFAMAGGSLRHNALAASVTAELVLALRGKGCRVLSSDQRVSVRNDEHFVYPDVSVVCAAVRLRPGSTDVLTNPSIVVEVLSKSTEAYDRGLKWESYRELPSVTDYVLVSQSAPRLEHFRREADGEWHYSVAQAGGRVVLSNGAVLSVDTLFAGAFDIEGE